MANCGLGLGLVTLVLVVIFLSCFQQWCHHHLITTTNNSNNNDSRPKWTFIYFTVQLTSAISYLGKHVAIIFKTVLSYSLPKAIEGSVLTKLDVINRLQLSHQRSTQRVIVTNRYNVILLEAMKSVRKLRILSHSFSAILNVICIKS